MELFLQQKTHQKMLKSLVSLHVMWFKIHTCSELFINLGNNPSSRSTSSSFAMHIITPTYRASILRAFSSPMVGLKVNFSRLSLSLSECVCRFSRAAHTMGSHQTRSWLPSASRSSSGANRRPSWKRFGVIQCTGNNNKLSPATRRLPPLNMLLRLTQRCISTLS